MTPATTRPCPPESPPAKAGVPLGVPVNRLALETSPYLLQHAHNPVDWYPWGTEVRREGMAFTHMLCG